MSGTVPTSMIQATQQSQTKSYAMAAAYVPDATVIVSNPNVVVFTSKTNALSDQSHCLNDNKNSCHTDCHSDNNDYITCADKRIISFVRYVKDIHKLLIKPDITVSSLIEQFVPIIVNIF